MSAIKIILLRIHTLLQVKSKPSLSDIAEYEQHIKYIMKTYSSQKWSFSSLDSLLDATSTLRRKWIKEDCPTVKEVLLKFPCLREHKLVSSLLSYLDHTKVYSFLSPPLLHYIMQMMMEFCRLTASDKPVINEKWEDMKKRIFCYAAKEDRKQVKRLLSEYHIEAEKDHEGKQVNKSFII